MNATASSASTSVSSSNSLTSQGGERRELAKRRFTEEKDDKLPENLLGYQVGLYFIQLSFMFDSCSFRDFNFWLRPTACIFLGELRHKIFDQHHPINLDTYFH